MTTYKRLGAVALGAAVVGSMLLTDARADSTVVISEGNHNRLGWSGEVTDDGYAAEIAGSRAQGNNAKNPLLANGLFVMGGYDGDDTVTISTSAYDGLNPAQLSDVSYSTYRFSQCERNGVTIDGTTVGQNIRPSVQVTIMGPHASGLFDEQKTTLVYEPNLDDHEYVQTNINTNFAYNQWNLFKAIDSTQTNVTKQEGWWSTANSTDRDSNTYADLVAALPDGSYISAIGFKIGSGWNGRYCAGLDNMTFKFHEDSGFENVTFDWEATLTTTTTALDTSNAKKMTVDTHDTTVDELGRAVFEADLEWVDANGDSFDPIRRPTAGERVFFTIGEEVLCIGRSDVNGHVSCIYDAGTLLPTLFSDSETFTAYHPATTAWHAAYDQADLNYEGLLG